MRHTTAVLRVLPPCCPPCFLPRPALPCRLFRWLAPGGRLLLTGPFHRCSGGFSSRSGGGRGECGCSSGPHDSLDGLVAAVEAGGFSCVEVEDRTPQVGKGGSGWGLAASGGQGVCWLQRSAGSTGIWASGLQVGSGSAQGLDQEVLGLRAAGGIGVGTGFGPRDFGA